MKIEVLYKDICSLYGDYENINYLSKASDKIEIIHTPLNKKPKFLDEKIDLVYMGSCPFTKTKLIISLLLPYKNEIIKKIKENQLFLVTGTYCEVFGKYILDEDEKIEGLGIFDYWSSRFKERHNSFFLGKFNDIEIVGNKSQFFFLKDCDSNFIEVIKVYGNDSCSSYEGLRKNEFYMTSLLGPFLILNPLFGKYLLNKKMKNVELKYESVAMEAYNYRLNDLKRDDARILMGDHG